MIDNLEKFSSKYGKAILAIGVCPNCGLPTYVPKNIYLKNNGYKPICVECDKYKIEERNKERILNKETNVNRNSAIARMKSNSIVTDDKAWSYSFDNYNSYDSETDRAKQQALKWAEQINDGSRLHSILTGPPGVGKTHLGFSIAKYVLIKSDYQKSVAIVSYRELLEQLKFSFSDKEAYKFMQKNMVGGLKVHDLVVIDDLGAELGKIDEPSKPTNFNLDTLTSLVEARLNKATIFTSNLNSTQLFNLYGERIYSRIINGATIKDGMNAFRFKTTTDKRKQPI